MNYRFNKHDFIRRRFASLIRKFKTFSIELIFIMDGYPSIYKQATIKTRKANLNIIQAELNNCAALNIGEETAHILRKKATCITFDDCNNMEHYFKKNAIKYIHHDNLEADVLCKWLVEHNVANYAYSNDNDLLAYGCKHILMHFNYFTNTFKYINYSNVLIQLNLSPRQFTDLCISCGTDFNPPIIDIKLAHYLFQLKCPSLYDDILISRYPCLNTITSNIQTLYTTNELPIEFKYTEQPCGPFEYKTATTIFSHYISKKSVAKYLLARRIYSRLRL